MTLSAVEAELRRVGVTTWRVIQGRHYKVRFTWNGRQRTLVMSRSPSDVRAVRNCLADLRRLLRNDAHTKGRTDAEP